jgi:hypothetical protein
MNAKNRVWVSTDFKGHYSVGVAAVVVAPTGAEARKLLAAELTAHGLGDQPDGFTLREVGLTAPAAEVLNNGDY